jgi:hypothetical protein
MAITYQFACIDCRQYLSLGKISWLDETGRPLGELTIDGVYDQDRRRWFKRDETFGRTVEGFLIRHRNHELRVVPEGVDELLSAGGAVFERVVPAQLVAPPEDGTVDPEGELESWKAKRIP